MTSKEQLLALVRDLPEDQATRLLNVASELFDIPEQRRQLPAFVGIGDSGRSDISSHVDEELAKGFSQ
jgi:hypothetical protein